MIKAYRAGRIAAVLSGVIFLVIGVLPTNILLLRPLEYRFNRPPLPAHVDGILALRGDPNNPIPLIETYSLALQYPSARVVYSGGGRTFFGGEPEEDAQEAGKVLGRLGLGSKRLSLEGLSKNTWENLLFSSQLIKPKPNEI